MKQVLHILKKDLRTNWLLILISFVPLIAALWLAPYRWQIPLPSYGMKYQMTLFTLSNVLPNLILIFWLILLAKVVQAESPVGDRKFWLTKPYQRTSLLGAKICFMALTMYLPLLVMQALILMEGGSSPWRFVPTILINSTKIFASSLLLFLAIVSVTSTVTRAILSFLGVTSFGVSIIWMTTRFTGGQLIIRNVLSAQLTTNTILIANLAFYSAAIWVQFRYRKTMLSTCLILLSTMVPTLISQIDLTDYSINHKYQAISSVETQRYQLGFDQSQYQSAKDQNAINQTLHSKGDWIPIEIPLRYKNLSAEYGLLVDGMRLRIVSTKGDQWLSPWSESYNNPWVDDRQAGVEFWLPKSVYSKFSNHSFMVELELALTEVKSNGDSSHYTLLPPLKDFAVAGIGYCAGQPGIKGEIVSLTCRVPFEKSMLMLARTARYYYPGCSDSNRLPKEIDAIGWIGGGTSHNAKSDWFPLGYPDFPLTSQVRVPTEAEHESSMKMFCPGTPVTFTPYREVRKIRTTITIDNYDLLPPPDQRNTSNTRESQHVQPSKKGVQA